MASGDSGRTIGKNGTQGLRGSRSLRKTDSLTDVQSSRAIAIFALSYIPMVGWVLVSTHRPFLPSRASFSKPSERHPPTHTSDTTRTNRLRYLSNSIQIHVYRVEADIQTRHAKRTVGQQDLDLIFPF